MKTYSYIDEEANPDRLNAPLLVWKDMVTIAIEACIVLQGLAVGQVLARMFFTKSGI